MLTGICWITYTNVYVRLLVADTCSLQFSDKFFECGHFVGLALNGLKQSEHKDIKGSEYVSELKTQQIER